MEGAVIIGCVSTTAVCIILLLICSFASLQVNEYGLDYSSISKTVNQTPFEAGVHFLGLGHHFLIFPKTVRSIEFSKEHGASANMILGRTQDGLQVDLEISFQYKLIVKDLYLLYIKFGIDYEKVFIYQSTDILLEQATKYTASDFFQDRFNIGQQMQAKLDQYFQKEFSSTVEFFQLRKVDLPDKFENSIQETEVQKQSISKAQAQKQKIEVELSTKLMEAEYQATVVKNLAQGDAQSIKYDGESKAKAFQEIQQAYGLQYKHIKEDLQFDNTSLVQYMKAKIIREYEGSQIIINLDQQDKK